MPTLRADGDAELDAGRRIVARGDGELEAGAVDDAGGHGDLQLVAEQLGAAAARSARTTRSTISPRPPQRRQVQRTGTSSGTVAPSTRLARRQLDRRRSAASARSSARNARRMRSTAGATDGKSMTTSSAKQLDVMRGRRRRR